MTGGGGGIGVSECEMCGVSNEGSLLLLGCTALLGSGFLGISRGRELFGGGGSGKVVSVGV